MNDKNPNIDSFLLTAHRPEVIAALREILLDTPLSEEFKWKQPCYTIGGKNIVMIGDFKDFCALSFFKGVLLSDYANLLTAPGPNSQSTRQINFTEADEVRKLEQKIRAYIDEAVQVEKKGLEIDFKKTAEYVMPEEFTAKTDENPALKTAFEALTPGRQRAYLLYFASAVEPETRRARIEKYAPRILQGYGLRDCVCGLSKKMPYCDGSHKQLQK